MLGNNHVNESIEIYVLAPQHFPTNAKAWHSLGEVYVAKDD